MYGIARTKHPASWSNGTSNAASLHAAAAQVQYPRYGDVNILIDARWQQHLIATLHTRGPFKSEHWKGPAGNYRSRSNGRTGIHRSEKHEVDDKHGLLALLQTLGVASDIVAASIKRDDATVARAAIIIAEWMMYLPLDCVKAMVRDGWHWST